MNRPSDSFRARDESDRSQEFVMAREVLVGHINDFLQTMRAKRDEGTPLPGGSVLTDTPRISRIDFGSHERSHLKTIAEERRLGASLTGDGVATPLELQVVRPGDNPDEIEVLEVTGSDPEANERHNGVYSIDRQSEVVASFRVTDYGPGNEQYFQYSVLGDGAVKRAFIDEKGWNNASTLTDPQEVEMAQRAFDLAVSGL